MLSTLARWYHISHPPKTNSEASGKPIKFGSLGAAKITPGALVNPTKTLPDVVLYAVAARDPARAQEYAKQYGFQKHYGGENAYQELIDDPEIDAVYNPLPNGLHFEWTMKALKGGKHVLLEKPATDTEDEARQIYELSKKKGLVVLEAFHYRFHPSIQRVKSILDSKELGDIKHVHAALTAPAGTAPPDDIRWKYELGGGSVMDPGCYTLNVVRYLLSSNPTSVVSASATPYSSAPEHEKVDKLFTAELEFSGGITAEIHSNLDEPRMLGFIPRMPKLSAVVECTNGSLEIYNFLIPTYYHSITVKPTGKSQRVEKAYTFNGAAKGEDWWTTYRYQLEAFVCKVQGREPQTWLEPEDTIQNMKWIEQIYAKIGFGSRPHSKYVYHDDD